MPAIGSADFHLLLISEATLGRRHCGGNRKYFSVARNLFLDIYSGTGRDNSEPFV
jgi:hypothetical protein